MKPRPMKQSWLKDRFKGLFFFLFKAVPSYCFYMGRHYLMLLKVKPVPTLELVEARLSVCRSCVLYSDGICSNKLMSDGKDAVKVELVSEGSWLSVDELTLPYKTVRTVKSADIGGSVFVRGCGCKVERKAKIWFSPNELARKHGYAPCPLNKWTYFNLAKQRDHAIQG